MTKRNDRNLSLKDYLDSLVAEGRHWFTITELQNNLPLKEASLRVALSRFTKVGSIKIIRRGFGIILPAHGKELHPSFYVDAMMKHLGASYYVGLLSAAAFWGASHQASMAYQIIADKVVTPVKFKRGRLEFVTKKGPLPGNWIRNVSTLGGYIQISSPELTSIDMIRFPKKSGRLNNVATIISELVENWDGRTMSSVCHDDRIPTVTLQRLGYILDEVLGLEKESSYPASALKNRKPSRQLLSAEKKVNRKETPFNETWSLYINTKVEPD